MRAIKICITSYLLEFILQNCTLNLNREPVRQLTEKIGRGKKMRERGYRFSEEINEREVKNQKNEIQKGLPCF